MSDHIEAAMVACPRCKAKVGSPCVVRACRNGYRNCQFAVCAYWREAEEPHLERAVAGRQAAAALRVEVEALRAERDEARAAAGRIYDWLVVSEGSDLIGVERLSEVTGADTPPARLLRSDLRAVVAALSPTQGTT